MRQLHARHPSRGRARCVVLGVVAVIAALSATSAAQADGDPASDTLVARNAFYPYATPPTDRAVTLLEQQLQAVRRHGDRIKVAVIQSPADLGSLPGLFNKPAEYAAFLGQEIRFYYVGPLLIVMPAGFGIYDGGRSTAAENDVLSQARISGGTAEQLIQSATAAVTALLARGALRSKDILAPYAYPIPATGAPGSRVQLDYSAFDDSGRARVGITVLAGTSKQLALIRIPLRAVAADRVQSVSWQSPEKRPARLRFCVVATDPAGNRGRRSCAPITLR